MNVALKSRVIYRNKKPFLLAADVAGHPLLGAYLTAVIYSTSCSGFCDLPRIVRRIGQGRASDTSFGLNDLGAYITAKGVTIANEDLEMGPEEVPFEVFRDAVLRWRQMIADFEKTAAGQE